MALPQLLPQLGGGPGALSFIRLQPGWVSAPDSWIWFWLKNLGWFAPLLLAGLVARRVLPERAHRFMWAFMTIFAAVNLVVFQPWDWDDHKLLVYWFLAVAIVVGALLAKLWRRHPDVGTRTLIAGVLVTMLLSGVLEDVGTALGQSRYRLAGSRRARAGGRGARQDRSRRPVHHRHGEPGSDRDADGPAHLRRLRELALDRGDPLRGAASGGPGHLPERPRQRGPPRGSVASTTS